MISARKIEKYIKLLLKVAGRKEKHMEGGKLVRKQLEVMRTGSKKG